MPICTCPHCGTHLKVKETQLNVAQGFVKCADCEGLFKAKDFVAKKKITSIDWLPDGISDFDMVSRLGVYVRGRNAFSKEQAEYLIDHPGEAAPAGKSPAAQALPLPERTSAPAPAPAGKSADGNWTLAALVALTVLILQLFYILLNR